MKAALFEDIERLSIVDMPVPEPGPGEVLIEVAACGVCGTDLHIYHGEYTASYPLVPGHEFSGTVVGLGEAVTSFKAGDRVTVDPNIPCNRCRACHRGQPMQCQNMQSLGGNRSGGFAQYTVAPETNVFPIGDLSFSAAAFTEPLACVISAIKRMQVQPGDSVLLFGAGPTGCLMLQTLRRSGAARVVVTEQVPWRLKRAAEFGAAETVLAGEQQSSQLKALAPPGGYDLIVDASGNAAVYEQAFDLIRPFGKIAVFGVCPPDARATFRPFQVFRRDLTIVGSHSASHTFLESITLLENGAVQAEPLISHRFPVEHFKEALEIAEFLPERMKVQVVCKEGL